MARLGDLNWRTATTGTSTPVLYPVHLAIAARRAPSESSSSTPTALVLGLADAIHFDGAVVSDAGLPGERVDRLRRAA
jgi:hypothetical protein